MKKYYRREKGFTLIELLTAIAIVGVLAGLSINLFTTYSKKGYRAHTASMIQQVRNALEAGRDDAQSGMLWAWTNSAGPVVGGGGQNFLPGVINGPNTMLWAWRNVECDEGLMGGSCAAAGSSVNICRAGVTKSWMRLGDGLEISWEWEGAPWC